MRITRHSFGTTRGGQAVTLFRMENSFGSVVEVLDYGCIIRSIRVPDRGRRMTDVVLGYDTIEEYESHDGYFGAVVGRVAGRISNACFTLNGKTWQLSRNDGENQLHGGIAGFSRQLFDARISGDGIAFTRCSPNGEEGYPGTLFVRVLITFSDDNALTIAYEAAGDTDTVVNLTNHSYFNLAGGGDIRDEELAIHANYATEMQSGCLTTGRLIPVAGTVLDFTRPKPIGRDLFTGDPQLICVGGYDHYFVLDDDSGKLAPAAELYAPSTGIGMRCLTTLPGLQVYTSNSLSERAGKSGATYRQYAGLCLEAQHYPDAPTRESFPPVVLRRGETYSAAVQYTFYVR